MQFVVVVYRAGPLGWNKWVQNHSPTVGVGLAVLVE